MNVVQIIAENGFKLIKASNREWHSACPICGGKDRLSLRPDEVNTNGRYWGGRFVCRGCGAYGDAVALYMKVHSVSYREAARAVGVLNINWGRGGYRAFSVLPKKYEFQPEVAARPNEQWQKMAVRLMCECQTHLQKYEKGLGWLREDRFLSEDTIWKYGLGWNPFDRFEDRSAWGLEPAMGDTGKPKRLWIPEGLVIPSFDGADLVALRIRRAKADAHGRYVSVSGSSPRPMVLWQKQPIVMIVESALDAILIHQEAGALIGVVALGSAQKKPDSDLHKRLQAAQKILVTLDADDAGAKASRWWLSKFTNAERWPTINGKKDPCEMHKAGIPVRKWVEAIIEDNHSDFD